MIARRYHRARWLVSIAVLTAIGLALAGYGLASSTKVVKGPTEHEIGNYVAGSNIGIWWMIQKLTTSTEPASTLVPSTTVSAPTALPSNGTVSYAINAGTTGAATLLWIFQASTSAPSSTEFELKLNFSLSGNTSRYVDYLTTPAVGFSGQLNVRLYFAVPSASLSGGTIQSVTEFSAKCLTVGTCP